MEAGASDDPPPMLRAPRVEIDALPYIDGQYNEPAMRAEVERLIAEELKTFAPRPDALAHLPAAEPDFANHPMLQAEWLRVNAQEPMPTMDVSRYQLDPPPKQKQQDPMAWERSVGNAQAQLEHQATRLDNLELLQQHGANQWLAHLSNLERASSRLASEAAGLSQEVDGVNRSRKEEQVELQPKLARLEAGWVGGVKKNLQIEAECLRLEAECAAMRKQLDPTAQ
mmetsp:Transcript_10815/g.32210  ORF Transcript_10815/g.32210 Transcript_10815/m.32210 type:complete len:226 (-) Transcript_10815:272-949(-)